MHCVGRGGGLGWWDGPCRCILECGGKARGGDGAQAYACGHGGHSHL